MGYDMTQVEPNGEAVEEYQAKRNEYNEIWQQVEDNVNAVGLHLMGKFMPTQMPGFPKPNEIYLEGKVLVDYSGVSVNGRMMPSHDPNDPESFRTVKLTVPRAVVPYLYDQVDEAVRRTGDKRAWEVEDPSYFRLNVWGMRWVRAVMLELGLLDHTTPIPHFPEYPGHEHWDIGGNALDDEAREYDRKVAEVTAFATPSGFPAYNKFTSNDGWHVTGDECAKVVFAYDNLPTQKIDDALAHYEEDGAHLPTWVDWISYIRRSAETNGFTVW